MADNSAQDGTDTIATDDIGGVKHQRVKVQHGADGSATDVSVTTPLPVTIGTTTGLGPLGITGGLTAYGAQRVTIEPTNIFSDTFDTATGIDTVKWTAGGTVAPTVTTGAAQVRPGVTTASASSSLVSKPVFAWPGVNFLGIGWIARFENVAGATGAAGYTNSHRFYGFGDVGATWVAAYTGSSTSGPVRNGVGFETDTDGFMYPVVYDNGTRTRPSLVNGQANLNVGRNLFNGQPHQFLVVIRAEAFFWYVDGTDVPVAIYNYATTGFSAPDIAALPLRFHQINATSATSGVTENRIGAVGIGDTGRNSAGVSDGAYPWREASVTVPSDQFTNPIVGGSQGNALNVNPNSIQKATYYLGATNIVSGVLTANTNRAMLCLEHTAGSVRTVRVRRIIVSHFQTTTLAGLDTWTITRGTAASSAGTAVTPGIAHPATPAAEATARSLPTITAATNVYLVATALTAGTVNTGAAFATVYDWAESGETVPLVLRAGSLDTLVINVQSTAAKNITASVTVIFTEE